MSIIFTNLFYFYRGRIALLRNKNNDLFFVYQQSHIRIVDVMQVILFLWLKVIQTSCQKILQNYIYGRDIFFYFKVLLSVSRLKSKTSLIDYQI